KDGHDGPRRTESVTIIEVIGSRVVEVHRLLDQPQTEQPPVEVEIALRVAANRRDMVDAGHPCTRLCTRLCTRVCTRCFFHVCLLGLSPGVQILCVCRIQQTGRCIPQVALFLPTSLAHQASPLVFPTGSIRCRCCGGSHH